MGYESWFQLEILPDPAVGAVLRHQVPGETFEMPQAFRYKLVTSAVVKNRFAAVTFLDGDKNSFLHVESNVAIPASTTAFLNFFINCGGNAFPNSGEGFASLPAILMPPGTFLQADVTGIDVGDQISGGRLFVRRYPSGQWVSSPGAVPYSPETEFERG